MLRGLYTATAGMMTQQRVHDTVTNNIANLNTPGYKQVNAVERSFPGMLVSLMGGDQQNSGSIGRLTSGVFAEESMPLFIQGDIMETQSPSDFALVSDLQKFDEDTNAYISFNSQGKKVMPNGEIIYKPQAFFTVQNEAGETRYTQDGKFIVNANGELMTNTGMKVLDVNRQVIQLDRPISELGTDGQGNWYNSLTGEPVAGVGQILISRVENPNLLVREGDGNYKFTSEEDEAANAMALTADDRAEVRQGFIERSNVNAPQAMVNLMAAARAYEANQKVIQFYDKSLDKVANEVGRV